MTVTHGARAVSLPVVYDLANDSPELWSAVKEQCPLLGLAIQELRTSCPLANSAAVGINGTMYRLPNHRRSICMMLPVASEAVGALYSPVLIYKGTEPLLSDFPAYLEWMLRARFRNRDLPVALHFPLSLRMPPGAFPIDECTREQRIATEVHRQHLARYGCLAHSPVPLISYEFPPELCAAYARLVRTTLPLQAVERIEWRIQAGLGVGVYYYPSVPLRVADLEFVRIETVLAGEDALTAIERTVRQWAHQFARFLWMGYIPYGPWNQGWGTCVDPGNACIDGGFADLLTLVRASELPDSRLYAQCVLSSTEALLMTSVELCARGLARSLDAVQRSLVHSYVRSVIVSALRNEAESSEAVQPYSPLMCFEPNSLEDALDRTVDARTDDEYDSSDREYGQGI